MVEIENLTFGYFNQRPLFSDLSIKISDGEPWTIVGPSGCGKTTLLHLLAGLKKANSGVLKIDGNPINRPGYETGLILQDHGLLPWATVHANITLGFKIRKFYGPDGKHTPASYHFDKKREETAVQGWLKKLDLEEIKDRFPSSLSGGQRQRAAIARTLVLNPKLLLMDEPFSSLDAVIRLELQQLTKKLAVESGHTRILVTHDINEAIIMGAKILVIGGGGKVTLLENIGFNSPSFSRSDDYLVFSEKIKTLIKDYP